MSTGAVSFVPGKGVEIPAAGSPRGEGVFPLPAGVIEMNVFEDEPGHGAEAGSESNPHPQRSTKAYGSALNVRVLIRGRR